MRKLFLLMGLLIILSGFVNSLMAPTNAWNMTNNVDFIGGEIFNSNTGSLTNTGCAYGSCMTYSNQYATESALDTELTNGKSWTLCGFFNRTHATAKQAYFADNNVGVSGFYTYTQNTDLEIRYKYWLEREDYIDMLHYQNEMQLHCMIRNNTASRGVNGNSTNLNFDSWLVHSEGASGTLYIGSRDGSNFQWYGTIDEIYYFANVSLTGDNISSIWNNGNFSFYDPVIGWTSGGTTPTTPVLSDYNITSNNMFSENTSIWNTADTTVNLSSNLLSVTFTTDMAANCSMRLDNDQNYTTMIAADSNYKLATTDATSHAGTLYDNITFGDHALYIACISSTGYENATSQSGDLNLTYWDSISVTLNEPANNSNLEAGTYSFNFTPSSQSSITGCSLYTNFSGTWNLNGTNTSSISNGSKNSISNYLSYGNYIWNVNCSNDKFNNYATNNFTLISSNTPPSWTSFNLTTIKNVDILNKNVSSYVSDAQSLTFGIANSTYNSSLFSCSISSAGLLNVSLVSDVYGDSNCILNVTDGTTSVNETITVFVRDTYNIVSELCPYVQTLYFDPPYAVVNPSQVPAIQQNINNCLFNVTNNESVVLNVSFSVDSVPSGYTLKCNENCDQSSYDNAFSINSSLQIVKSNLGVGSSFYSCCWVDIVSPAGNWEGANFYIDSFVWGGS